MTALSKLLAGTGAIAAVAIAAPAAAQYYPGYGGYGYSSPYGQVQIDDYGPGRQVAINQCASAAQTRVGGYGNYGGYGAGRVLGISQVLSRGDGGFTIRGVAASGGYGYGYAAQSPDLTWRCVTDFRGFVREVTVNRAAPAYGYGYNYTPWNDYSQYGYRRY